MRNSKRKTNSRKKKIWPNYSGRLSNCRSRCKRNKKKKTRKHEKKISENERATKPEIKLLLQRSKGSEDKSSRSARRTRNFPLRIRISSGALNKKAGRTMTSRTRT